VSAPDDVPNFSAFDNLEPTRSFVESINRIIETTNLNQKIGFQHLDVMTSIAPALSAFAENSPAMSAMAAAATAQAGMLVDFSRYLPPSVPLFDQSWISEVVGATRLYESLDLTPITGIVEQIASSLPSLTTAWAMPGFEVLTKGFQGLADGPADSFGSLFDVLRRDDLLSAHFDDVIASTQGSGSFGFDFRQFEASVASLSDRLEERPDLEAEAENAVHDIQEATGFRDETMLSLASSVGLIRVVRAHHPTGPAIAMGVTAGLMYFMGHYFDPSEAVEAVAVGGGVYLALNAAIHKHMG